MPRRHQFGEEPPEQPLVQGHSVQFNSFLFPSDSPAALKITIVLVVLTAILIAWRPRTRP